MEDTKPSPTVLDSGGDPMRRTSSQTSGASTTSKKAFPAQRTPKSVSKSSSVSSLKRDASLTSFPSLSPEQERSQQDGRKTQSMPQPIRTSSQRVRERKRTLASLTSASGSFQGQPSLFDDSPRSSLDIPGALHLASDEHIERLIARSGAVKLVRQFAQDLALRDVELSALRARADDRERELKKMLREAEVSSSNIEKRLHNLETTNTQNDATGTDARPHNTRQVTSRIDDMMHQAMAEDLGGVDRGVPEAESPDPSATMRPIKTEPKRKQTTESTKSRGGSVSGWQFWGNNTASPKTSRPSSLLGEDVDDINATARPRAPSSNTKRRGLDSLFQPSTQSTSYFIGGTNRTVKKPTGDEASVHSQKSSRSLTSWTKMFAGNALAAKDDSGRPRSSSVEQDKAPKTSAAAADSLLSRVRTNPSNSTTTKSKPSASNTTLKTKPTGRRTPTPSNLSAGPDHVRSNSESTNLGPVELDAILNDYDKPPTMTHTNNKFQADGLLTDRFGFIYDQRQRKRQRMAGSNQNLNRLSGVESLGNFRNGTDSSDENDKATGIMTPPKRPATPASIDEDSSQPKKWSDYLKVSTKALHSRPTELLSHTPSAGAIVTVNTADATGTINPPRQRSASISVKSQLALPVTSFTPRPRENTVTATANDQDPITSGSDQEPVKLLLEQLNELQDSLQAERETKFNDFLRKVRADRGVLDNDLPNEVAIGVGNLGHPKNRAKYAQFKALVLAGIPVSLRPKMWAECSGATSLRIPSYYDELVARSLVKGELDRDIDQQIAADIPRTLTDNIFFRTGPGMKRLEEILKAYSLHSPDVGYCQGMNLITASLLLIMPTSEDVFWLLVAIVDKIMPSQYFDRGLRVSRSDQLVLRGYVAEVLPKLDAKLEELGVELEACTFQWFLSLYSAVVSAEPLFRIWDVVLCLNSSETPPATGSSLTEPASLLPSLPTTPVVAESTDGHDGTCSPFLFQLSLALLKLNERALLEMDGAGEFYSYINHNMTNHAIGIDQLISAAEALRVKVKREDVLARRRKALEEIR